jgi:RNA polymerase sigma-70 factor (ECF subfamily)
MAGATSSSRVHAAGSSAALTKLLADDAVMISDGGAAGISYAGIRNLPKPLIGSAKIAAFLTATARRDQRLVPRMCELNGQPAALLLLSDGQPLAAILLSVADGQIRRVFVQADATRLRHLGPVN